MRFLTEQNNASGENPAEDKRYENQELPGAGEEQNSVNTEKRDYPWF